MRRVILRPHTTVRPQGTSFTRRVRSKSVVCSDVYGVVYWDILLGHGREAVNLLLQVVRVDLTYTGEVGVSRGVLGEMTGSVGR